ncbi:MAG: enoyl-CoA hydratase/isomerase family protein, partial [Trebonia sp.]
MEPGLNVRRRGDVLDLILCDPERGNLITEEIGAAMAGALAEAGPDVKLVRLSAEGPDFCRGRKSPPIDRTTATAMDFRSTIAAGPLRLYGAFRDCRAPVLGVVQGRALGVGCALAGMCDLTVASDDATFALPEMNHNIPPTLVISALADRIPYKTLCHLVLLRDPVTAAEALTAGLIGQVVPRPELDAASAKTEASVLECTAAALQGVKEFMRSAAVMEPTARAALASSLIATVQASA